MMNNEPTKYVSRLRILYVILCIIVSFSVTYADGTANLSPTATDVVILNLNTGNFANYGTTGTDKSMCFTVKDPSETVYFGFSQISNSSGFLQNANYDFRIVDAVSGAVVQGPFTVTPGNANGNNYNDVIAGPDLGSGVGYDVSNPGFVFNPPAAGEYCIEFENGNAFGNFTFAQMGLLYWDVTVADAANTIIPGRLFSTCWGLRTPCSAVSNCTGGPWDQPLNGEIWVLTDDGFVHSIDFANSGFQGLSFFLAFNDTGPGTTGNPVIDRKSIDGNFTGNASATDPLYPIYFDIPDPECYEAAEIGTFEGPTILAEMCDYDNACLEFTVNQTGLIEIIIDLDGPGDGIFTPNTADTVIAIRIDPGEPFTQCVPWDLTDGLGNQLMPGDDVFFTVNYQQGEIHFMQYDVESVLTGFIPSTIVPTGANNLSETFYDDSCLDPNDNDPNLDCDLDPATGPMPPLIEIDGCPAPCHTWKIGNSSGLSGGGYGEVNTINTWWFGNTQTLTIETIFLDENPPTFDCPPDVVLECGMPTDTLSTGSVTNIMDACSTTGFIITFMDDAPFDACSGTGIVTRTFYVEDPDGNIDSCMQMITLMDSEDPMITCPPGATIACTDPVPVFADEAAFIAAGGTISDNCALAGFALTDSVATPLMMGCLIEEIALTYTATDECGMTASCTLIILVENTDPASFGSCPPDAVIECGMPTDTMTLGAPVVEGGACGIAATITVMDDIVGGTCPDEMVIMRLFILDDGCGEPDTCMQMISIEDPTAPVFDMPIPADVELSCADDVPDPETLNLTDNCGSMFMVMPVDVIIPGTCPNDFVIERTWALTDPCGNEATATQIITVSDTEDPTFDTAPPADLMFECAADVPDAESLMATDNCDGPVLVDPIDTMIPGTCPNDFTIERTWEYIDACNNVLIHTQTITVSDTSDPAFDTAPPVDLDFDCAADVPDPMDLSITDNCDGTVIVSPLDNLIPGSCPNDFTIERTWEYEDACGNAITHTQTITVSDTSIPMFDTPPPTDITLDCAANVPDPVDISVMDNCDGQVIVSPIDNLIPGTCPNDFTIERTWEYIDACGNTLSHLQTIVVSDTSLPVFDTPPPTDIILECAAEVPDPVDISVTDNCDGNVIVSPIDNLIPGTCPNDFTIERTWEYIDACGNTLSHIQTIVVGNTTLPVFDTPPPTDLVLECATQVPDPVDITVTDNCDGIVTVSPTDNLIPGTCPNDFTIERTWEYIDACGNTLSHLQTIIVSDTSLPVFDTPPPIDIVLECAFEVPPPVDLMVTDNCDGPVVVSPVDVITNLDLCPNRFTIDRTWSYTDACGNELTHTQLIAVDDITPPELECQDLTIDLMGMTTVMINPEDFIVSVSDNCGDFDVFADPPSFDCSEIILDSMATVEIIAIDSCGNQAVCIANITFTGFPELEIFCPNDTLIQLGPGGCDAIVPYDIIAINPCGEDAVITQIDTSGFTAGDDFPIGVTIQEYMATNEYGDTVSCSFTITVLENDDPITSLVCNDKVNISVDQNCMVTIDADLILEGSNHGCFEDFTIEIFTITGDTVLNPITYDPEYSPTNNNYIVCVTEPETGIQCCGEIILEDKLEPAIECPCPPGAWMTDPACQRTCLNINQILNGQIGAPNSDDNCSGVVPVFGGAQIIEQAECGTYIVEQFWSLTTEGHAGPDFPNINCTNEYFISAIDIDLVTLPDDVTIDCSDSGEADITHPSNTGYPRIGGDILDGQDQNPYCNIVATFTDIEIPSCGSECGNLMKIARIWSIVNWCTSESEEFYQLIKISDEEGPTIVMDDVYISTDVWKCSADVWFDPPQLHDNCSYALDWYIVSSNSGAVLVDANGQQNSSEPKQHALDVPKGTWEFVIGSTDCCGNLGTTTIEVTVSDHTAPVAIAKEYITISLTSAGLDPDGFSKLFKSSINEGSHDNCSDPFIEIRRETDACDVPGNDTYSDKIPSVCDPWYASDDLDYGEFVMFCCNDLTEVDDEAMYGMVKVWMRVWDDANMDGEFGSYTFFDNPGTDHDYCEFDDNFNEVYSWIRVENKTDANLICPPDITIPCDWDYTDLNITGSASGSSTCGAVELVYEDWVDLHCGEGTVLREWSIPGYDYSCTQVITITPVYTALVVQCPVDPVTQTNKVVIDCDNYDIPEPVITSGACSLTGITSEIDTFWFEADACYKAIKTWTILDWCSGEELSCEFTVSLIDTEAPLVMCQDTSFGLDDFWDLDNDGNRCEFENDIVLTNSAGDPGNCGSEWIKWLIQIDYWSDGIVEYEGSSFVAPNSSNYVAPTQSGADVSISLDKEDASADWARHLIKWKAFDGCGNVSQCSQIVEVGDDKAPTPFCLEISTALMDSDPPLVEIWANDFDTKSGDNCTPRNQLLFTFEQVPPVVDKLTQEHCFDASGEVPCSQYENGFPIQKWNPATRTSGTKFIGLDYCGDNEVRVSIWDNKLNMSYCRSTLIIHGEACDNVVVPTSTIGGIVRTENLDAVTNVRVEIMTAHPEYPKNMMTLEDGMFAFEENIMYTDYNLIAAKDGDYLNGVSTLDLVFIQRHILGLKTFDSHYKSIAADANNDSDVSGIDLVELRKLILGVYEELPLNDSWRIVDPVYTEEINAPFPFSESIDLEYLDQEKMDQNFIAIKIGDVNGNASLNFADIDSESRSLDKLEFILDKSNSSSLEVRAGKNFDQVYGFQFVVQLEGSFENIRAGKLALSGNHIAIRPDGTMAVSYHTPNFETIEEGELLFSLDGINDMQLVDGRLRNESYKTEAILIEGIEFRGNELPVYETKLLQNEPNPFTSNTQIRFVQAEKALGTLTIYDLAGKKIKSFSQVYDKGMHSIELSKKDLGAAGVLYYRYETGNYSAVKKMIVLE